MWLTGQAAAELANEAEHRTLTRRERLALAIHARFCRCAISRNFAKQLTEMKRAYRRLSILQARGSLELDGASPCLSDEAKARIRMCLKEEISREITARSETNRT